MDNRGVEYHRFRAQGCSPRAFFLRQAQKPFAAPKPNEVIAMTQAVMAVYPGVDAARDALEEFEAHGVDREKALLNEETLKVTGMVPESVL